VLTRLAKVTKATGESPMMKRALSLSERAATVASMEHAVDVKLTHARVLDACGLKDDSERAYMKAVLEHSESLQCIAAYTQFLKSNGEGKFAECIEQDVLRKSSSKLSDLVSDEQGSPSEKQSKLLALRGKRERNLSGAVKGKKEALTAISGAKHAGLGDFKLAAKNE